ncbi:putative calcium-transporting ATPase 13, plasma membrane-type [Vitis vinifera]|uniref:Putative calcium-transporting ATPase 13, plasma membrane-type n=1 Tax=Vitis vinifera TaxID=29760 RepID=A0A438KKP2_VITVI|nr:putative calcium-transporting ATPase 13, plasma membrane-type [Vitis vinifera]
MSTISRDTNEQTPLQARLNKLTSSIGKVGLAVASLVLLVLLVRYFTGHTEDENGNQEFHGNLTKADDVVNAVVRIIAVAVTIVVVAIPEGLPLAVTLTLAYSMKRMMAEQAMVRRLSACETMGSATTICTDKTGTLTLNQMKVTKFGLAKTLFERMLSSSIATNVLKLIQQGVALNTTGSINMATSGSRYEFSAKAFNSEKKRSGVALRSKADNKVHVHWERSSRDDTSNVFYLLRCFWKHEDLDHVERTTFEQIIQGMAASSLRCIALHTANFQRRA